MVFPFRVLSLADNLPWLTALGNDYAYENVFVRPLMNFAQPGDVLIASSVTVTRRTCSELSNGPIRTDWKPLRLWAGRRGRLAEPAKRLIVLEDTHYGRVEDAQMAILHLLCFALAECKQPPR